MNRLPHRPGRGPRLPARNPCPGWEREGVEGRTGKVRRGGQRWTLRRPHPRSGRYSQHSANVCAGTGSSGGKRREVQVDDKGGGRWNGRG